MTVQERDPFDLYNFRKARFSDMKEIKNLVKLCPELKINEKWMTDEDIKYCILNEKGVFQVVWDNTKIIAFIYGFMEVPSTACLMYICVHPEYRKRSIAECLFNYWHTNIADFGVMNIYALATTEKTSLFLNKIGFDWVKNGSLIYMERESANIQ